MFSYSDRFWTTLGITYFAQWMGEEKHHRLAPKLREHRAKKFLQVCILLWPTQNIKYCVINVTI